MEYITGEEVMNELNTCAQTISNGVQKMLREIKTSGLRRKNWVISCFSWQVVFIKISMFENHRQDRCAAR